MRESTRTFLAAMLLLWLLFTTAAAALFAWFNLSRLGATFDTEARTLHRVISQRADQHDALMTSLSAVAGNAEGADSALRPVAEAMLRFYPRIEAIDVVTLAPVPRVTFTTRETGPGPQDPVVTATALAPLQPGQSVVRPAGEAGGYGVVKRTATGGVIMTIDARRLAEADSPVEPGLALLLSAPDGQPIARMGVEPARGLLPAFTFAKELGSRSQPLSLSIRRQPNLDEVLPPLGLLLIAGAAGVAVLLGAYLLRERRAAREARERAAFHAQDARFAHAARVNMVGEMASGIVHELTQPLTAILSQSQAGLRLARAQDASADILGVLEANARGAKRAGDILARFRDYIANRAPEPRPTPLNGLVREVAELAKADLDRKGVTLALQLAEEEPRALVDRVSIEQVVHNLLTNAVDAVEALPEPRRSIVVTTGATDGAAFITVRDQGEGIPPANLPRLFEPFFTTKDAGGLGLGLPLCERLVERFGGQVSAANDPAGGALFTIRLPALEEAA